MTVTRTDRGTHRKTAVQCFNETWEYLEKKHRRRADDRRMLDLVHTARFHWGVVGAPENQAVSDWQVSRVYAALRSPELALWYAQSSLDLCRKYGLTDFRCTALEAMARAYAVGKDPRSAREFLARAREQLNASSVDAEDRRIFEGQIRETERLVRRLSGGSASS